MSSYAPIALFVYNRPYHTRETLNALASNNLASESDLFVFSDSAKNVDAKNEVDQVRDIIKDIKGFKSLTIIEREENFGLVRSISTGVSEILKNFGRIIVVEDDLLTHKQFLEYMNKSLKQYQDSKNVFEISGYSHLSNKKLNSFNETYFLKITSTWGWATWVDRWSIFFDGLDGSSVLNENYKLRRSFNYDNSYNYYKMLKDNAKGKVKSWGIVWYWNIFKKKGLTLYPSDTLVDQIGFDGSGQNAKNYMVDNNRIKTDSTYTIVFPDSIEEDPSYRKKIVQILKWRKVVLMLHIIRHFFKLT